MFEMVEFCPFIYAIIIYRGYNEKVDCKENDYSVHIKNA